MDTRTKIYIGVAIAALLAVLMYIVKIQHDMLTKQQEIERSIVEFKQLGNGLARIEGRMTTDKSDLEKQLKNLGVDVSKLSDDLKENGAKLEAISVSVGTTKGYKKEGMPSDWQAPIPTNSLDTNSPTPPTPLLATNNNPDCSSKYGYCNKLQGINLYEEGLDKVKIPFGNATFNATSSTPWGVEVYPRKYYSILSMGKDATGRIVAHSQMMIEDKTGQKHKIAVDESSYIEQVAETSRMYWWNPRIMAGYSLGATTSAEISSILSAQFFMSSYTSNKSRPKWSFIGIGGGYDIARRALVGVISPVMYNLFPTNEFIQNVYIGPTVGLSTQESVSFSGTISLIF